MSNSVRAARTISNSLPAASGTSLQGAALPSDAARTLELPCDQRLLRHNPERRAEKLSSHANHCSSSRIALAASSEASHGTAASPRPETYSSPSGAAPAQCPHLLPHTRIAPCTSTATPRSSERFQTAPGDCVETAGESGSPSSARQSPVPRAVTRQRVPSLRQAGCAVIPRRQNGLHIADQIGGR